MGRVSRLLLVEGHRAYMDYEGVVGRVRALCPVCGFPNSEGVRGVAGEAEERCCIHLSRVDDNGGLPMFVFRVPPPDAPVVPGALNACGIPEYEGEGSGEDTDRAGLFDYDPGPAPLRPLSRKELEEIGEGLYGASASTERIYERPVSGTQHTEGRISDSYADDADENAGLWTLVRITAHKHPVALTLILVAYLLALHAGGVFVW